MATCLTIAGSDPSGGAGIQADLRVFEYYGVRGLSAITAVTAQTSKRFMSLYPVPADVLTQQLAAVAEDMKIDVIKTGMLATAANVQAIVMFLKRMGHVPVVIDPVLDASAGFPLLELSALPIFEQHLLPLATVITPNIKEAETLAKMRVVDVGAAKTAAKVIHENVRRLRGEGGILYVIVKGGHLHKKATDILFDGNDFVEISGEFIDAKLHGTGCRYSSALAACIALGSDVAEAAAKAKEYVTGELRGVLTDN